MPEMCFTASKEGRVRILLSPRCESGRVRQLVLLGSLDLPQLWQTFMDYCMFEAAPGRRFGSDRPFHRNASAFVRGGGRLSRAAWAGRRIHATRYISEGMLTYFADYGHGPQQSEIVSCRLQTSRNGQAVITDLTKSRLSEAKAKMAQEKAHKNPQVKASHRDSPNITNNSPTVTDLYTTSVTNAQLQAMIDEGVTAVLAARATTQNGDDSHTSGTESSEVYHLYSSGNCSTGVDLTCWTVTNEWHYAMTWSDLKKKMTTKYVRGMNQRRLMARIVELKVQGTDVVATIRRVQELALRVTGCSLEETEQIKEYGGGMP
ncbi:hypothetical protein Tco_0906800 [Tanacetum coccineum]|uniref:Uncharacterized protein n=1 Tax=Tanacetum coccineum TaxID=301880 RepID=A0ABQ5CHT9_9ASTR